MIQVITNFGRASGQKLARFWTISEFGRKYLWNRIAVNQLQPFLRLAKKLGELWSTNKKYRREYCPTQDQ